MSHQTLRPVYLVGLNPQLQSQQINRSSASRHTGHPSIFRPGLSWWWCCTRDWLGVFKHCILSGILYKLLNQINLIVPFIRSCKKPAWEKEKKSSSCKHIDLCKPICVYHPLILKWMQNRFPSKQQVFDRKGKQSLCTAAVTWCVLWWHRLLSSECKYEQSDGGAPLAVKKSWYFHNAVTAQRFGSLWCLLWPVSKPLFVYLSPRYTSERKKNADFENLCETDSVNV